MQQSIRKRILQEVRSETPRSPSPVNKSRQNPSPPSPLKQESYDPEFDKKPNVNARKPETSEIPGERVTDDGLLKFFNQYSNYTADDFSTFPERSDTFWKAYDVHHVGQLFSVRAYCDEGQWGCYTRRRNLRYANNSVVKFPMADLRSFLKNSLVPIYQLSKRVPAQLLFEDDPVTHNYALPSFWESSLVRKSPDQTILIRPFLYSQENRVCIRLWQMVRPVTTVVKSGGEPWNGPCLLFSTGQFCGWIMALHTLLQTWEKDQLEEQDAKENSKSYAMGQRYTNPPSSPSEFGDDFGTIS